MSISIKSNPRLWNSIKKKFIQGSRGGVPGKNSARKMQMAVKEYISRGGKYIGKKSRKNSMAKWTREDWGYINEKSKRGRYLPKKVRKSLSKREKEIENRRKGSKKGKRIKYSKSVSKKMRKLGIF